MEIKRIEFASGSFSGLLVKATRAQLTSIFGKDDGESGDGKVTSEWNLSVDGNDFRIYDWKEYRTFGDDEVIEWHVGNPIEGREKSLPIIIEALKEKGLEPIAESF